MHVHVLGRPPNNVCALVSCLFALAQGAKSSEIRVCTRVQNLSKRVQVYGIHGLFVLREFAVPIVHERKNEKKELDLENVTFFIFAFHIGHRI